jgi:hypothetical protein
MFGLAGLAAMNQGYQDSAQSYWKMREAEDSQAAYDALGKTFMSMSAPQGATPGGLQAGPPGNLPGMPPGGPMPGAGGPPGGPSFAQNSPLLGGLIGKLVGGAAPGPGGQPSQMPGPGGPAQVAGPPQASGAPPMAGAPTQVGPPGGSPAVPPQLVQQLGSPPYDWRSLAGVVAQANPNASPGVIARAVTMMAPLMNQDSQQQWRQISAVLREQQLQIQQGQLQERERAAGVREGQTQQRIEQSDKRIAQGDKRLEIAQQQQDLRVEQARARAITSAQTNDLKEREFAFKQWDSEIRARDRYVRAQINAMTNLSGADKEKAKKEADAQFNAAMDELKAVKKQIERPTGGQPSPSANTRVPEGFDAAGAGGAPPAGGGAPIPPADMPLVQQNLQRDRAGTLKKLQDAGYSIEGL